VDLLMLEVVLGFGIGLSLGLLGGGGSILTVPALVYLIGQSPQAAVATSLAIVGANSVFGALFHSRGGSLNWKVAVVFGGVGMAAAYLAAGVTKDIPPALIMVLFAALMILVGVLMLARREKDGNGSKDTAGIPVTGSRPETLQGGLLTTLAAGASVGMLTGILGVGGGFLIVPALVVLVGLPMYQAVGTSLAVIAANSAAGLLGHIGAQSFDLSIAAVFIGAGIAGTYGGVRLARVVPARRLRKIFALFVIVLAIFLLFDNLPKLIMA
jgi:uncharacterized protein